MLDERLKNKRHILIPTIFALALFAISSFAVVPVATASNAYTPTTLSIGGSTLLAPLMSVWQTQYGTYTSGAVSVNYQAVGSGSGTANWLGGVFSLGYSDAPIPANGLATINSTTGGIATPANSPPGTGLAGKDPVLQVVDALAPVSIFYNIPGFRKTLNLTGDVIAEIFLQHITAWNDPHILALNKGLTASDISKLAANPITVVHRSDGSGTSFALTYYFGQVDGNWTAAGFKAGSVSPGNFPASELSGKGTGGVAGVVSATNGAVGYGETSYAIGAGLVYAAVQNQSGNYILPLPAGATAAAAADASILATNPVFTITNAPGAASYPISTYTYVFVWENQNLGTSGGSPWTQGLAYDVVQFLYWIVTQGQNYATSLQYAPLPAAVVTDDLALIAKINYGGQSFLSTTSTSITCNHSSIVVGRGSVSCTSKVSGTGFSGSLLMSSSAAGTFNKPAYSVPKSGKVLSIFKPGGASSSETITALYVGDLNNAPSIASTTLTVTKAASKTTLLCKPASVSSGSPSTCTVTVIGFQPSGIATISQSAGSGSISGSASCVLAPKGTSTTISTCTATVTGSNAGSITLKASYPGDSNNAASSGVRPIKVL
jgi:phosphate transport system substrate-binding protein